MPTEETATAPLQDTAIGRLRWAVAFAAAELGTFREGDWTNLRENLERFLGFQDPKDVVRPDRPATADALGGFISFPTAGLPRDFTEAQIRELQREALRLLSMAIPEERKGGGTRKASEWLNVSADWSMYAPSVGPSVVLLSAKGATRDLLLMRLLLLCYSAGPQRIKRCPAPDCGKLYWKAGRRKYCSSRCAFQAWEKTTEKGKTRSVRAKVRNYYSKGE